MIVTVKASSPRKAAAVQFECIKFGVECDLFANNFLDLTIHDIDRAKTITDKTGTEIVAVIDKIIFDPIGAS
jgi:hypothetical protein